MDWEWTYYVKTKVLVYEEKIVSIAGDTKHNKLSDILAKLDITEAIEDAKAYQDAACTNPANDGIVKNDKDEALFKVYNENGVWYVDAINAFSTEHGLVIRTADKAEYVIKVTDATTHNNDDCITFSSVDLFSIMATEKRWDGQLFWSTDKATWTEWYGGSITAEQTGGTGDYKLYLYGTSVNTKITYGKEWKLNSSSSKAISCIGNIETLRGATGDNPSDTEMGQDCYNAMFSGCSSLTTAPELRAKKLAPSCYCNMFNGCTELTTAPELPATTLENLCYESMFMGCSSLKTAPALPATTLAENCYANMFSGCSSLKTTPELPAKTLADSCYKCMFFGCTSLESAKELPATTLATNSYASMFAGCSSLTTAPTLRATTLAEGCCLGMFNECSSLTTAPALQAETMACGCYQYMFVNCISLTTAPALPATALADDCYLGMFTGCSGLKTAPALPAETMAENCYYCMFANCTSLAAAPSLPIKTLAKECCTGMFINCTSLKVNESGGTGIFTCPSTIPYDAVTGMFALTTGTFIDGTPIAGNTYYYPVSQYTVTLNGNGASTAGTASIQAIYGNAMPTITNLPTRSGYSFDGYYDSISGGNKYYNADGTSARNWDIGTNMTLYAQWIKNDEPKSSGSSHSSSYTTGWHQSGTNWQYVKPDGSFAKNEWVQIEVNGIKQWYHFGNDTNMDTGWLKDTDGSWYYLSKEQNQNAGTVQTGWMTDPQDGHRYYLDPKTGKMATGWTEIDGKMYYFSEGAATESGWTQNESSDWVYSKRDSIPLGALIQ